MLSWGMATTIIPDTMIARALAALRASRAFATTTVIEKITGQPYRRNPGIAAYWSPNARVGRRLAENAEAWSIEAAGEVTIVDADGVRTRTMTWTWA